MSETRPDPIVNVIQNGIRRDIDVLIENRCTRGAIILILAGIDAMAYLGMPADRTTVERKDFIAWVERWLRFPGAEQLTGADVYGARCAMLHNYGIVTRMVRRRECRMLGYMNKSKPEIRSDPEHPEMILVSIEGLRDAFFKGIDEFLVYTFAGTKRKAAAQERLDTMVHELPLPAGPRTYGL
jgi:hypothetical protein